MQNFITYLLKGRNENSDEYYKCISCFADEVLQKIDSLAEGIIDDFMDYVRNFNVEELRSREEYKLEFLIIVVLGKVYMDKALAINRLPAYISAIFSSIRMHSKILKHCIDNFSGKINYKYLIKSNPGVSKISYSRADFKKLIVLLKASGEFRHEIKRIKLWLLFLNNNNEEYILIFNKAAFKMAAWFEKMSRERLGEYTINVGRFLTNEYKSYALREDNIFCGRIEIEYHLNMVGAEILNRAFREKFLKTREKIVLLPACMCLKTCKMCRRKKVEDGFLCTGCSGKCKVNILTKLGRSYGFKVLIIPHETDALSETRNIEYGDVGIVGIACVLNLIEGGLKARYLNLIPQCVVLDYCGCSSHWHKYGIQTDINNKKLYEILKII